MHVRLTDDGVETSVAFNNPAKSSKKSAVQEEKTYEISFGAEETVSFIHCARGICRWPILLQCRAGNLDEGKE